eukprot:gb/GECG01008322.1/.p1 GENE.gb/GECG01008322.1/~~gb/GECG01008322.1/.p1  ORF type:complete len:1696 (+),score=148.29 gb/GECG01008322.1/:1-5088(+)
MEVHAPVVVREYTSRKQILKDPQKQNLWREIPPDTTIHRCINPVTSLMTFFAENDRNAASQSIEEITQKVAGIDRLGKFLKNFLTGAKETLQVSSQENEFLCELQGQIITAVPILEEFSKELLYCFDTMDEDQWKRSCIALSHTLEEYSECFSVVQEYISKGDERPALKSASSTFIKHGRKNKVSGEGWVQLATEKSGHMEEDLLRFCRGLRLRLTQNKIDVNISTLHDVPPIPADHIRRSHYVTQLSKALVDSKIVGVCGSTGSGKTSIVAEYVHSLIWRNIPPWTESKHRQFDNVVWVYMDRIPNDIDSGERQILLCKLLVDALGLREDHPEESPITCIEDFEERLARSVFREKVCVVLDNVENACTVESIVNTICQTQLGCSAVITCRREETLNSICCLHSSKTHFNVDYIRDRDFLKIFLMYRCGRFNQTLGAVEDTSVKELIVLSQGCLLAVDILGGIARRCKHWSWARIIEYVCASEKPNVGGLLSADVPLNVEKIVLAAITLVEPDRTQASHNHNHLFHDMLFLLATSDDGIFSLQTLYFVFKHAFDADRNVVDIFLEWVSDLSLVSTPGENDSRDENSATIVIPLSVLKVLKAYLSSVGLLARQYKVLISAYGVAVAAEPALASFQWFAIPSQFEAGTSILRSCLLVKSSDAEDSVEQIQKILLDYQWIRQVLHCPYGRFYLMFLVRQFGAADESCQLLDLALRRIWCHPSCVNQHSIGVALNAHLLSDEKAIEPLPLIRRLVNGIASSGDTFKLLSGSLVSSVSRDSAMFGQHRGVLTTMNVMHDWLLTGDMRGNLKIWNVKNGICIHNVRREGRNRSTIHHVSVSSNGRLFSVCGSSGSLDLWHIESGGTSKLLGQTKLKARKHHIKSHVWCSSFSSPASNTEGKYPQFLAVGGTIISPGEGSSGVVNVFEIALDFSGHASTPHRGTLNARFVIAAHPRPVTSVRLFAMDSANSEQTLISYSRDHGSATLWKLSSRGMTRENNGFPGNVDYDSLILWLRDEYSNRWDTVQTSEHTLIAVFCHKTLTVRIFSATRAFDGASNSKYASHVGYELEGVDENVDTFLITAVGKSDSEYFIVASTPSGALKVWQLPIETSSSKLPLYYYDSVYHSAAISRMERVRLIGAAPNDCYILTASLDGTVRLWNLTRKQCLQVVVNMTEPIELLSCCSAPNEMGKPTNYVTAGSKNRLQSVSLPTAEYFDKSPMRKSPLSSFLISEDETQYCKEWVLASTNGKIIYASVPVDGTPTAFAGSYGISLRLRREDSFGHGDAERMRPRALKFPLLECPQDVHVHTDTIVFSHLEASGKEAHRRILMANCERYGSRGEKQEFILAWDLYPEESNSTRFQRHIIIPVYREMWWKTAVNASRGIRAVGNAALNLQEWRRNPRMCFSHDNKYVLYCRGDEHDGGGIFVWDMLSTDPEPVYTLKMGRRNLTVHYLLFSNLVVHYDDDTPRWSYYVAAVCQHPVVHTLVLLWRFPDIHSETHASVKRTAKSIISTCEWNMDIVEQSPPMAFGDSTDGRQSVLTLAWGDQQGHIHINQVDLSGARGGDKSAVPKEIGIISYAHSSPVTSLQFCADMTSQTGAIRQRLVSVGRDRKLYIWGCTICKGFKGKGAYASPECIHSFQMENLPIGLSRPLFIPTEQTSKSGWLFHVEAEADKDIQSMYRHAVMWFREHKHLEGSAGAHSP